MISILIYLFHSFDLSAHPYPNLLHRFMAYFNMIICRVCTCLRLMMKHVIARNDPLFNAVNLFLALFRLIRCHILHPNSPPLPLLVVANTSKVNQKLHSQHQLANNNTVLLESVSAIFSHQHHGQSTCETNGKRRRCVAYAFSHLRPRCGGTF